MKKFVISLLMVMLVLCTCTCYAATPSFSDVPSSHWAYNYIEEAVEKGFVNGVGAGRYDPNGQISNAQFITMMTRAFSKHKPSPSDSSSSNQWWEPYLKMAYNLDLLEGMTAGTAMQNGSASQLRTVAEQPISRFDMAEAIQNIMDHRDIKKPSSEAISKIRSAIPDYETIPAAHRKSVELAYASGCLTGVDDKGTFSGNTGMTRAQAAVVLIRLDELSRTGTISNKVVISSSPTDPSNLTEGYWICYGLRKDHDYLYRFYPDGTYTAILEFEDKSKKIPDNINSTYELKNNKLYVNTPSGLFSNTSSEIKEFVCTDNGNGWNETKANGKTFDRGGEFDSYVPISWISKISSKPGIEYEVQQNGNSAGRCTIKDVDSVLSWMHNSQDEQYFFFTIELKKDSHYDPSTQVYSFAIAGERQRSSSSIEEIYQDDNVLVVEIAVGAMYWRTVCFNKQTGELKDIPEISTTFNTIKNGAFLVGYYEILDPGTPGRITLYTIYGDFIAELVDEKFLPNYEVKGDYIYYRYSTADPNFIEWDENWIDNLPYVYWRYNLSTGEREQLKNPY